MYVGTQTDAKFKEFTTEFYGRSTSGQFVRSAVTRNVPLFVKTSVTVAYRRGVHYIRIQCSDSRLLIGKYDNFSVTIIFTAARIVFPFINLIGSIWLQQTIFMQHTFSFLHIFSLIDRGIFLESGSIEHSQVCVMIASTSSRPEVSTIQVVMIIKGNNISAKEIAVPSDSQAAVRN